MNDRVKPTVGSIEEADGLRRMTQEELDASYERSLSAPYTAHARIELRGNPDAAPEG